MKVHKSLLAHLHNGKEVGSLNDKSNNDKENKKYLDEHDRRKGLMVINQIIKKKSAFVFIFCVWNL